MYKYLSILSIIFGLGFGSAWLLRTNTIDGMKVAHIKEVNNATTQYNKQLVAAAQKSKTLQGKLDDITTNSRKDMETQLAENERLRDALNTANSTKRMFLKGTTCTNKSSSTNINTKTNTGNDGTSIEVSGTTRQLVSDLRANIIRDRYKILYLQKYITTVLFH